MIKRREFIAQGIGLIGAATFGSVLTSCSPTRSISGVLSGPNQALGHRLRQGKFSLPVETVQQDVVIVGGGVAALSAARYLAKQGITYSLLELEQRVGGNAASGNNAVSAYPLGAHYLTVPGKHDQELLKFLEECKVIVGYEQQKPVFNDYYLCFDPKERLFIHNQWQEGLVPHQGVPANDADEIKRFHELMEHYKNLIGADGKEAFCIPLDACSNDPDVLKLDMISFAQFLKDQKLQSPYLLWYVGYCCADDFGASIENTSAWAGIHYFASHKGVAANAESDAVLTWPEGNDWLVNQLKKNVESSIIPNSLVYNIAITPQGVQVEYLDAAKEVTKRIQAKKVIVATPQFINQRILSQDINRPVDYTSFQYAPWMVGALTLEGELNNRRGEQLSWDNVIYGSSSLGYVNAKHQDVAVHQNNRVISFYQPMLGNNIQQERQVAYSRTYQQWYDHILKDLQHPHPEIEKQLTSLDIWIWGHGMVRPSIGFMTGQAKKEAIRAIDNKIFFAHSDLSGISIFEEAFFHGVRAAKEVLL
ncbi:MAG: NAD(P)/FAD-dependent oxidoreductase [Cytophagia bacterium]|nr:NAD(P)/FAD-dependent oxidoreductase [Cytophagia bacterium]NBW34562.1 NAD(P)/FAD-dependent oxidoreductase [Cytophagia bacterium]